MYIAKQSINTNQNRRVWFDYARARDAFQEYILSLDLSVDDCVALPDYIGFSEREGSGVFDPVVRSGVNYKFYKLDTNLNIDISSISKLIDAGGVKLIVLIHYFGYVDPGYLTLIKLARKKGIYVLEDQAHSLFTDLYGGISGRLCDASIYSLHKMFPIETGGALSIVGSLRSSESNVVSRICLDYDINNISIKRRKNVLFVNEMLKGNDDVLKILRCSLDDGIVPQTFPVLIQNMSRDQVYFKMNELGFGVVSLYHTMIDKIAADATRVSNEISRKILNLPIHQDASELDLELMCTALINILRAES
jgi:dTDP-4-amino-4,6-dideoxygalactose transaminase